MSGYLYVVQFGDQGIYKIGKASNIPRRMSQLQTSSPYKLSLIICYMFNDPNAVEKAIHSEFSHRRMDGEWFDLGIGDIARIIQVCDMLNGKSYNGPTFEEIDYDFDKDEYGLKNVLSSHIDIMDFDSMFKNGWRMERNSSKGNKISKYWVWRKGSFAGQKKSIYGGTLSSLPYPIEEMRRMYNK